MSKTKLWAITTALALTACANTTAPLVIPIKPPVPAALLVAHERPERPANGTPESLLDHAVRYGAYCQKLENQVSGWQTWYQQGQP